MATKKAEDFTPEVNETKTEKFDLEAYQNEKVPVQLFKDNGKYQDDVFVGVNGETCQIQRGEVVYIKRKFADVLERSQRQDLKSAAEQEQLQREFQQGVRFYNV